MTDHWYHKFKSYCRRMQSAYEWITEYNKTLSEYNFILLRTQSGRSLTYSKNNKVSRPCPVKHQIEHLSFVIDLLKILQSIIINRKPLANTKMMKLVNNREWGTLSKVFLNSKNSTSHSPPSSRQYIRRGTQHIIKWFSV